MDSGLNDLNIYSQIEEPVMFRYPLKSLNSREAAEIIVFSNEEFDSIMNDIFMKQDINDINENYSTIEHVTEEITLPKNIILSEEFQVLKFL